MNSGKRVLAAVLTVALAAAAVFGTVSCSRGSAPGGEDRKLVLSMGTGEEGDPAFLAGAAVASVINNEIPGVSAKIEFSKGSPVNAKNVHEGKLNLAIISGDAAYDAWNGTGSFEGEPKEKLCALGACYPKASQWMAKALSGLSYVHDLKGRKISAGTVASPTASASKMAFWALGITGENSEISFLGLAEGANALRDGTADGAHGFMEAPSGAFEALANEQETVLLQYAEEELENILADGGPYFRLTLPAGTYPGQEEPVNTFGVKVLLCASLDMEEELAYEIAKAMDAKSAAYTGGHRFMALMQDKEFLCEDLPIPLHPGAERYYREMGYLESNGHAGMSAELSASKNR